MPLPQLSVGLAASTLEMHTVRPQVPKMRSVAQPSQGSDCQPALSRRKGSVEGPERSPLSASPPGPASLLPVKWLSSLTIRAVLFTGQCSSQARQPCPQEPQVAEEGSVSGHCTLRSGHQPLLQSQGDPDAGGKPVMARRPQPRASVVTGVGGRPLSGTAWQEEDKWQPVGGLVPQACPSGRVSGSSDPPEKGGQEGCRSNQ